MSQINEDNEILKKAMGYGHICKEVRFIVKLIDKLKVNYRVVLLCKVLAIPRNTYYSFRYKTLVKQLLKEKFRLFKYIEGWYNRKIIYGSIVFISPYQCEKIAKAS